MDAVEKYIINVDWTVGTSTIIAVMSSNQMKNRPGTLYGLHYHMSFHLVNSLSTRSIIRWTIYVKKKGQTGATLQNVGANVVVNHLIIGDNRAVLASGVNQVVDEVIRNTEEEAIQRVVITDEAIGSVKTARKMQTGDELILIAICDAILGVDLHGTFTFWKKS